MNNPTNNPYDYQDNPNDYTPQKPAQFQHFFDERDKLRALIRKQKKKYETAKGLLAFFAIVSIFTKGTFIPMAIISLFYLLLKRRKFNTTKNWLRELGEEYKEEYRAYQNSMRYEPGSEHFYRYNAFGGPDNEYDQTDDDFNDCDDGDFGDCDYGDFGGWDDGGYDGGGYDGGGDDGGGYDGGGDDGGGDGD